MNNAGAIEVLMPVVQPSELWQESGRWEQYGPELLRIADRGDRPFVLGPTHEEVITDLIRNELNSYKQLPLNFYQIQTKFRDEVRPRFGVMRSREFLMKDAYSFHTSQESLQETYDAMYAAYSKIFSRMGLDFRAVQADTGSIGGSASHEFQVLAQSGEDDVIFSDSSDYAANIEFAEAVAPKEPRAAATQEMTLVDTPNAKTIAELVEQFNLPIEKTVKTLLVKAVEDSASPLVALLVRGDHELNEVKAENCRRSPAPDLRHRRRDPRPGERRSGLPGPGEHAGSGDYRPYCSGDERFRRWRQYRWQTLLRHQLGPRCRDAGSGRHP